MVWRILHYAIYLYKKAPESFRLQYFIILIFFKYTEFLSMGLN